MAQLLYQGLQNHGTDPNNAYSALLEDMAESKFALVAEGGSVPATHPLVRSGYAVLEAMAAHANATHSYLDRNYFNDALTLLDDTRDAEELAKLKRSRRSTENRTQHSTAVEKAGCLKDV